jgi:uncharacterized protein with HEPN domain
VSDPARITFFLGHVVEAIDRIQGYVAGMDEPEFLGHHLIQDAVVRNLEVIGEACNNVRKHDPTFVAAHPEIPWRNAIGNRNLLSHGYFHVSYHSVWNTVQLHLPALRAAVAALLP